MLKIKLVIGYVLKLFGANLLMKALVPSDAGGCEVFKVDCLLETNHTFLVGSHLSHAMNLIWKLTNFHSKYQKLKYILQNKRTQVLSIVIYNHLMADLMDGRALVSKFASN